MLNKLCFLLLATIVGVAFAEPEPVYFWNFERSGFITANGQLVAPGGGNRNLPASCVVEDAFDGGAALLCQPGKQRLQIPWMEMP